MPNHQLYQEFQNHNIEDHIKKHNAELEAKSKDESLKENVEKKDEANTESE